MKSALILTLLLCLPRFAVAQETTDWTAATTAAREVYRQLNFMNEGIASIPGPPEGRGLYGQVDQISGQLMILKNKLAAKESRESLYIAFGKLDMQVQALLSELKNFEAWDKPLRFVAQRLQSAEHDLSFALAFGDDNPKKQTDALYRQTLGLLGRTEALGAQVQFVFSGFDSLALWQTEMKNFRGALVEFQRMQQKKAEKSALKDQLAIVNTRWAKLVDLCKSIPQGQYLLLQQTASALDASLVRLDGVFGIRSKARLPSLDF